MTVRKIVSNAIRTRSGRHPEQIAWCVQDLFGLGDNLTRTLVKRLASAKSHCERLDVIEVTLRDLGLWPV